ncbi:hypothetical protein B0E43_18765 [Algoriphagus sp. A40]|nr:hypothetical protein B0E43_18765 [Algoriphagus sp. A40]
MGCSSKDESVSEKEPQDSKFSQPQDSFTKNYLFDGHQNLLRLEIDQLTNFQMDSFLRHLFVMDQKFRIELNENKISDSIDRAERRKIYGKMDKADKINYTLLKRIHGKFGWPSNKVFSDSAVDASFFITLHYRGHDLDYLTPLIEESFSKKEIKNDHYAILTDRVLLRYGKSQKFGTHCRMTRDGTVDFTSLPDTSGINQNRREIGLKELNWKTCDLVSY